MRRVGPRARPGSSWTAAAIARASSPSSTAPRWSSTGGLRSPELGARPPGLDRMGALPGRGRKHRLRAGSSAPLSSIPTSRGTRMPRSYVFLGRKLEHAWWYPDYQLRLFRRIAAGTTTARPRARDLDVADRHARPAARAREPQGPERVRRTPQPLLDLEAAELSTRQESCEGAFTGHWADRRALKDWVCSGCRRARRSGSSGSTC